jgi:hypothetical protein
MPDLTDGLEFGEGQGEIPDPNTEAGFDASLALLTGGKVPEGREARPSLADGLEITEEPTGQPRNPDGKFAPQTPETPAEEQATPPSGEEQAETPSVDPEIAALLERHGGDAMKALTELEDRRRNAESKIGQQGNELGELRQQMAKLEGRFEEAAQQRTPASSIPIVDDATQDWIEDNIARYGGNSVLANLGESPIENAPLIEAALEAWEETDDRQAIRARIQWENFKANVQAAPVEQVPQATEEDPFLQNLKAEALAKDAAQSVMSLVPAEQRDLFKPHVAAVIGELPENIAQGLFDPDTRESISKIVADLARSRVALSASTEQEQQRKDAAVASKQAAQVATGSLRPAGAPEGTEGEMTKEERTALFHKALFETPDASISAGLTYGK